MKNKDRRLRTEPVEQDRRGDADRRQHERVLVNLEVDYKAEDNFLYAYITDVSAMGIFIQTDTPYPPGTQLNLRFRPPGGASLDLDGRVMWVNQPKPRPADNINPGMGVQFVNLTAAAREQVMQLVRTFAYLADDEERVRGNS